MAKRVRRSAAVRPTPRAGARPPVDRTTAPARSAPPATSAAVEPVAPVTDGGPAAAAASRPVVRSAHPRARAKPGSLLASRAATEYVYVGQDLRRILVTSLVLFGALIALWLVVVMGDVSPLY